MKRRGDGSWKLLFLTMAFGIGLVGFVTEMVAAELSRIKPTNSAPMADAGYPSWGEVGERVMLDGSRSWDVDDPDPFLESEWVQVAGPPVFIDDLRSKRASFVPLEAGSYRFKLTVSDGVNRSSETVVVEINGAEHEALH